MKLYEVLLRKVGLWSEPPKPKEAAPEDLIYNPIGCKIGGVVKIDALDFRDHRFTVREIREYSVSIGGSTHHMADYVLMAPQLGGGGQDFNCRLRIVPDKDSKSKCTHRALLMTLYDDLAYNEGLHGVVKDDTKKFVIDDDTDPNNVVHDEFWRVNDVGISYVSDVKILSPLDSVPPGALGQSSAQVEFWDYSRLTDMEGVEVEEFVFVEMNKGDGWFKIWRGSEVNPERIDVF